MNDVFALQIWWSDIEPSPVRYEKNVGDGFSAKTATLSKTGDAKTGDGSMSFMFL